MLSFLFFSLKKENFLLRFESFFIASMCKRWSYVITYLIIFEKIEVKRYPFVCIQSLLQIFTDIDLSRRSQFYAASHARSADTMDRVNGAAKFPCVL